MSAPHLAKVVAIPLPTPVPEPVTRINLSFKSINSYLNFFNILKSHFIAPVINPTISSLLVDFFTLSPTFSPLRKIKSLSATSKTCSKL